MDLFKGRTANEAWIAAALALKSPQARVQQSRLGVTREIPQGVFVITEPTQRWVYSRTPPANVALALAEVIWIVAGRCDTRFLINWSKKYEHFVGGVPQQHDAYGRRLRFHFGLDQLIHAAQALSANPETRQVVLQLWDASSDFPMPNGLPSNANIPCNVLSMLKVREGRLEWTQILRSNDLYRGTPYNFMQFTSLQEIIAGWIGVAPGPYTHFSDSLHVYEHEFTLLESSPYSEGPSNTDSLALPLRDSLLGFKALEEAVLTISNTALERDLLAFNARSLPLPLANILVIFLSERLRQLHFYSSAKEMVTRCTNSYLESAWISWADYLSNLRV